MCRIPTPPTALRVLTTLVVGLALLASLLPPAPARAQEAVRCFDATGHCIQGAILAYWEANGGLDVFGYPISPLRLETIEGTWTGPVQWFERDRLEDHGINGVLAGRLGAHLLEAQEGHNIWDAANWAEPAPDCRYFEKTRQNLCEPFLSHWVQNGGLERFGYPLTGQRQVQTAEWSGVVQYFERRRMERHPEGVLLGLLGRELFAQQQNACTGVLHPDLADGFARVGFRSVLGCPHEVRGEVAIAWQPFERGRMLRADLGGATGALLYAISRMPVRFQRPYADTWPAVQDAAADQVPAVDEPPPGRVAPQEGFRLLWQEHADLRDRLGWATGAIAGDRATVQRFDRGWLLFLHGSNTFVAFGPEPHHLMLFTQPVLSDAAPGEPRLLLGAPAPRLNGELVVRTQSVDFFRIPGGLTAQEVHRLSSAVEESIATGSTMLGSNLKGRIAVRFEPAQVGPCAIRGLTLSNQRTIRMYYGPGSNLWNIEAILAHEFIHQLQHDYYGVPYHLTSDIILLEGMAVWGSNPYYMSAEGVPYYHLRSLQAIAENNLLPLTTSLEADCRTTTRNFIYDQWASFAEYLLLTYGRERFDTLYVSNNGRPAGSSNYRGVYGKSLDELEADWVAWLVGRYGQ